jgi:copper chaperone CopZ
MNVKKGLMKMENIKVKDVQVGSAKVEYNEEKVSISDFSGAIKELGFELVTHNAIA